MFFSHVPHFPCPFFSLGRALVLAGVALDMPDISW